MLNPKFEILTVSIALLLTIFILSLIACILTHTSPHILLTSIASPEIGFVIKFIHL